MVAQAMFSAISGSRQSSGAQRLYPRPDAPTLRHHCSATSSSLLL